jgi:tRNA nucleotidyltransferase (CCA-adding enzyme)
VIDWKSLLLEDPRPGLTLRTIAAAYPKEDLPKQVADLIGCPQDSRHHPEGDAFQHTTHVLDAMGDVCREQGISWHHRWKLMIAALCHDFGKAVSTKWHETKQKWVAYGHDIDGVPIAEQFISEYLHGQQEKSTELQILRLVRWHMVHTRDESSHTERAARKLLTNLHPASYEDLLLLMEADCRGRPPIKDGLPERMNKLTSLVNGIRCMKE